MLRRERNGNPLKASEEGDVETTKKILNNFNYANFLPMGGQLG
jgi:hypothetical protein